MARQMLQGLAAQPRRRAAADDWLGLRRQVEQDAAMLLQLWQRMGVSFETKRQRVANVPCLWIRPPEIRRRGAIVLYTHGGGYVSGSARDFLGLPHGVAMACGLPVLSIDYRLAPEHPFPAAVDDTVAVYRRLLETGFAASNLAWLGESAGGGLALAAVQELPRQGLPAPAALALLCPWLDLTMGGDSAHAFGPVDPLLDLETLRVWARHYCGRGSPQEPGISPLFGHLDDLPPLLVQSASKDLLLSDAWRLTRRVRRLGGSVELDIWDGMWHAFQGTPGLPEAEEAVEQVGAFLRRHLP